MKGISDSTKYAVRCFLVMYLGFASAFVLVNFLNSIYTPEYFLSYWIVLLWALFAAAVFMLLYMVSHVR